MATSLNATRHSVASTTWQIDPTQSRVEFSLRQRLLVARLTVHGRLPDVSGTITRDEQDPTKAHVDASIGVASVNTGIAKRDRHLQDADFFDVMRYPRMRFTSDRVEDLDPAGGRGRVRGNLTLRGVTQEVLLDVDFPPVQERTDEGRLRFTASAVLNRRDFGLTWKNLALGLGDIVIGDTIRVTLSIEATRVEPR